MSVPSSELSDVVVVGGGPGGSSTAILLAAKGHRVVLLEREHFPREHVGESLLPASIPILESLGVIPAIEAAGFLPKHGATMVWGSDSEPWSWYFRETNRTYPSSFQVTRPEFDTILLRHAQASGVDVREGHQAVEVTFENGRASGVRYRSDNGHEGVIAAGWVVDASGQNALIGHALDLREWDDFFRNLAIYGYFKDAGHLPEPDTTNIFIESYEHGWCWTIPLHTGQVSVGVVLDSEAGQGAITEYGIEGAFRAQLAASPRTAALLDGASLVSGPHVVRDWSYLSRELVGPGYLLVGDAACFVDPLFSSGVHLALSSGLLAAAYISSVLRDPSLEGPAAEAYSDLYLSQYRNFHELAKLFYASNQSSESYFWEARRISANEAFTPRHAFIRMVAGQSPIGYERAVIAHGDAPTSFVSSVEAVEAERAQRRYILDKAGSDAIAAAVPRLSSSAKVERKPVLEGDEFRWGLVLTSDQRPEGMPLSLPVARLLNNADGNFSVAELSAHISDAAGVIDADARSTMTEQLVAAVGILYVDGAIEELVGL